MPQTYHLQNIRTLLIEGFSEDDLRTFCFDTPKFESIYDELAHLRALHKSAPAGHWMEPRKKLT